MTLGLIARGDNGGLGALTWEVCRHVQPDRVLLIDMHSLNRGGFYPERFKMFDVTVTRPLMDMSIVEPWIRSLDNVFTAETFYDPRFTSIARAAGVHTTLYAMPELTNPERGDQRADSYLLPCEWSGRWSEYPVLQMPVSLDRFDVRNVSTPALTFFHLPAPAMEDRAGTSALLACLPYVDVPIKLVIGGANGKGEDRAWHVGNVEVQWLEGAPDNYFDVYPKGIDAFITPRRYGALSLPMMEAAALGLPIITTDLVPQNLWFDQRALCSTRDHRQVPMKGGWFAVHEPDPISLAGRITDLATDPDFAERAAKQNRAWAESRSWDVLAKRWRQALK